MDFRALTRRVAPSLVAVALLGGSAGAATRTVAKHTARAARLTDANIAAIVLAANTIDIDNANVALKTSNDSSVTNFARQMVTDHTSVNDKAKALAAKLNLKPVPNATSRSLLNTTAAKRKKLAAMKGAAFNRAYMDNEVTYHQAVIDMLNDKLVPGAKNTELHDLLTSVQPAFAAHLEHAKQVRAALKD